jgi:hypothetical protein
MKWTGRPLNRRITQQNMTQKLGKSESITTEHLVMTKEQNEMRKTPSIRKEIGYMETIGINSELKLLILSSR